MATVERRALTPGEKKERDEYVRGMLDEAVERVSSNGEDLVDFVVASSPWAYGWANRLLLWQQGCRGPVMSYADWRRAGRNVKRGETGLWIYAGRFPARRVFSVSQTEGAAWTSRANPEHPSVIAAMRVLFEDGPIESLDVKGRKALLKAAMEAGREAPAEECHYCGLEGCESCMG